MKCQQCERPATFHITELTGGKPQELHLCEDHARQYLTSSSAVNPPARGAWPRRWPSRCQQMAIGQTAEELAHLDQQACPVCGITFYEFRSQGRLGCPHDYVAFQTQLEPLIMNVHGESEHVGKRPRRGAGQQRKADAVDPPAAGNEGSGSRARTTSGPPNSATRSGVSKRNRPSLSRGRWPWNSTN